MTLVIGSLQLGFLYGILALGIYVTFRILNIPDLTAEGSFTLGLAASAVCTLAGHPVAGIVAAAVAGALAGCVTGVLQTKMGIHAVLAGILTMCGLYTINLIVMGSSPNISLINVPTVFKAAESLGLSKEAARLVIAIAAAAVCLVLLILFFRTHLGLCIRATGDNEAMVSASSINGEVIVGKRGLEIGFFSSIFGSIIYRYIIAAATKSQIFPAYALKLVSACFVAAALALPAIRYQMGLSKMKRTRKKDMCEQ